MFWSFFILKLYDRGVPEPYIEELRHAVELKYAHRRSILGQTSPVRVLRCSAPPPASLCFSCLWP
jgi:hypothetical protein